MARTGAVAQCGRVSETACSSGLSNITEWGTACSSRRKISLAGLKRDTDRGFEAHNSNLHTSQTVTRSTSPCRRSRGADATIAEAQLGGAKLAPRSGWAKLRAAVRRAF